MSVEARGTPETGDEDEVELAALNEPQATAVAHHDGPLIVFAGAGSGKTRVITYRIANLVATHRVPPYRILAVTFTNKAAGEMRERLETVLGPEVTRELWIGTFHSVCVRLIRRYSDALGRSRNFTIYDDSDQKALMKRVLEDLSLDDKRYPPKQVLGRISSEKQEGRGPDDMEPGDYFEERVRDCFAAYQQKLDEANAVDFNDLLLLVMRLAERDDEAAEHLRNRFSHVLVDEFQDTNRVQYRLVSALSRAHGNICVVGDDDQSIYRWRGADIRNIRNFTRDFAGAKLVKLEQNYRSTKHVVGAALGVIARAAERQPKELWTANDDGPKVKVVHCANERDEAAFVVKHVKDHIEAGVSPREIAVFYRVHAQSRVLEEVMRHEQIPYQIIGGTKFFDRAEIKDLLAYLRVISNPNSDVDLLRIINKPPRKIGNKTIERLTTMARREGTNLYDAIVPLCASDWIGKAAKKHLGEFDAMMQRFARQATTASVRELAQDVLTDSGYAVWLQKQDNAEADARIDNLQELLGSMSEYEDEQGYADEEASLADYLTRVSLVAAADTMEEIPRVPMMTVHAAKGLEFDVVLMTGFEERLFPLRGQQPGEEQELEEERRLAYVAITRSRRDLYVSHTNTRTIYGQMRYNQPARFLDDIPAKHQERMATPALHDLSRSFSRGQSVSHRDFVRAGATSPNRRSPSPGGVGFDKPAVPPKPPARPAGERFVEAAEHDDWGDADGFDSFTLRVGAAVRHTKFGVGRVRAIAGGSNPVCVVRFDGWGDKRIKLSYLQPA